MKTTVVTIAGPDHRMDLAVSAETPVGQLIPTFVELAVDQPPGENGREPVWQVAPAGRPPLPEDRTLAELGVADGSVLVLTEARPAAEALPRAAEVHRAPPPPRPLRGRTRDALPERLGTGTRLSAALRAFFGLDEADAAPPPQSAPAQLTLPAKRTPVERFRTSWRETDYHARLERRILAPRLNRCATIAIVSPKGGVGKTTITALLGSMFARLRRDRVVAVDTNPDYGSLGRTLTPEHRVFVDDLLDVLDQPQLTVTQLDGNLGRGLDGLMVLPAPTDPVRMAELDEGAYKRVILRLQDLVGILVLDCGTGLQEPAARAALATADQIVLVSDAEPATASLVAEAADLLRSAGPALVLMVNKLPPKHARLDLDALGRMIPDASALLTMQADPALASRLSTGGFSWEDAAAAWQTEVRELAVVLAEQWRQLGLAV